MDEMIFSLGTAVPDHKFDQSQLADRTITPLKLPGRLDHWLKKVSSISAIKYRFSVLEDYSSPLEKGRFYGGSFPEKEPSMSDRMAIYQQEAPRLALKAARDAIDNWGEQARNITHIISISCTGFVAPGIETILINELGLERDVKRFGLNFMGCMAAFNGLSAAQALAAEDPANRVLVVCTELCTLHYHRSEKRETLLGNVLFGDGAACAIVGCQPTAKETPLWRFEQKASWLLEDTENEMTWISGNNAYVMKLTSKVPKIIKKKIHTLFSRLISKEQYNDALWAIHPGGKAIIDGIEEALKLSKQDTLESRQVLHDYGNMSSPTILFVLSELIKKRHEKRWTFALGFGPGLSIESLILENMIPESQTHNNTDQDKGMAV